MLRLLLWIFLCGPNLAAASTHVLLIGINDYTDTELDSLDGPRNDVALIRDVMLRRFDVPAANIRILLDEQASHSAIRREFQAIATRAAPGDMVYIHYSGHGSFTRDLNGDERSGNDQTWVSYGARRPVADGDAELIDSYDVLDDEIEAWLAAILANTDHVIFVSDSCHSASVTRGNAPKVRAAPPDQRAHPEGSRVIPPWSARAVRIGAARDTQSAAEFLHRDGKHFGIFSWHWAEALNNARPGTTWSQVFQRSATHVQQGRRTSQQPQMEGNPDLLVFGGNFTARKTTVPVVAVRRAGAMASLSVGELAGVTVGSVYEVFDAEGAEPRSTQLEISRIWPHESEGQVRGGILKVGDLVAEVAHAYQIPSIRTFVSADTSMPADTQIVKLLRHLVADLEAYDVADSQMASDLVLRVVRPMRDSNGGFVFDSGASLPQIDNAAEPEVWIMTPLEELVSHSLRIPMSPPDPGLQLIGENLEKLARIQEFTNLADTAGGDSLVSVEAVLMTQVIECLEGVTCQQLGDYGLRRIERLPMESLPSNLPVNTLLTFAIANTAANDFYVYLISAGPDGEIVSHFPALGARADKALLESGKSIDLFEEEIAIRLGSTGKEVIKILASRKPLDLSILEQSDYAATRAGAANALEKYLLDVAHGTRGSAGTLPNNTWTAKTAVVDVTRVDRPDSNIRQSSD